MNTNPNTEMIIRICRQNGIALMGVADIKDERNHFGQLTANTIEHLTAAIVLAVHVSATVLNTLIDGPNLIYFHHYRQLNFQLDRAALALAQEIEETGYRALPIAASQVVDWARQEGHVSHKELARLAGMGWRGRNNLLVTPKYGAQVRLVSILTNLPLFADKPLEESCGSCHACLAVCPAKAIKEKAAEFDHTACYNKLREFSKSRGIGQNICGLCVRACPGDRRSAS